MHVLLGWQVLAVAGTVGMVAWGVRLAFADFLLDRFGVLLTDRVRRRDRRPDGGRPIAR